MQGIWKIMKSNKKETLLFSSTMMLAVILLGCLALHIPIPSPTIFIGRMLEPIVKPITLWLKGEA